MKSIIYSIYKIFESVINIILTIILWLPNRIFSSSFEYSNKETLCIFGNGPSLDIDIKKGISEGISFENVLGMNYFVLTEEFFKYKPNYYIFVDPVNFKKTNVQWVKDKHSQIVQIISTKLTWEMTVIIPWNYRFSSFARFLRNNKNINLHYLYNVPLWGGLEKINLMLMRVRLGTPPFQNVMVASIYWGVMNCFKEVRILGADHSWIYNHEVRQDNKLYSKKNHFYGETEYEIHKSSFGKEITISEELQTLLI